MFKRVRPTTAKPGRQVARTMANTNENLNKSASNLQMKKKSSVKVVDFMQ